MILAFDPIFVRVLDFDSTSERLRWIRRHQQDQTEILYQFDLYDPTKGWKVRPNLTNEVVFGDKILNTNSKSLRGKVEYSYDKPSNKTRILILGDSFTFGDEVSDTETYPHYLQEMLPQTEVINFGVHGYGHDQMLIYFEEEGIKYRPDVVILGFVYNDMLRNTMYFKDFAKPQFKLVNEKLVLTNTPVPPPELVLKQEIYRLRFLDLLAILHHKITWRLGIGQAKMELITKSLLDELIKTTEEVGAIPIFVYLPDALDRHMPPEEEFFTDYCNVRKIRCMSLRPYFGDNISAGESFKAYGGHWNTKGNFVAAQGIKEYLIEQKIVNDHPLE